MLSTELEAVNMMLSAIPAAPLNSLDGPLPTDAAIARQILSEVSTAVQACGYKFNTNLEQKFVRDVNGKIPVPGNLSSIAYTRKSYVDPAPVIRGAYLYDTYNKTDVFTADLTADKAVYILPWDSLPYAARYYITVRSSRVLVERLQPGKQFPIDESRAYLDFLHDDNVSEDIRMTDDPAIAWALDRRS